MNYDEKVRNFFKKLVEKHRLFNSAVKIHGEEGKENVSYRIVPPKEFMLPSSEYAIARGKEVIMECCFGHGKAHVFTAKPYSGILNFSEILNLSLDNIVNRGIFFCSLNALMRHLGLIDRTLHCRGMEPEFCGEKLAKWILKEYGNVPILLIGYQPAFAKWLTKALSKIYITDMNPENIGKIVNGVKVLNDKYNSLLMRKVKVALITGSALINSTLWCLLEEARHNKVEPVIYGVSAAGISRIFRLKRFCVFGK